MRLFKPIGVLLVALALSAIALAATASAAETLWKWLPGSVGETFKGKSGIIEFRSTDEGKASAIACKKSTISLTETTTKIASELIKEGSTEGKDATLALFIVDIEGCSFAGLTINSVGDKSGGILWHIEAHNCMIGPGKFGLLLALLQVHLEVPATKSLMLLRGAVIGELLGAKEGEKFLTYKLDLNAPEGVQAIKKCEGGVENKLESSLDGVTFFPTTVEVKEGVIEFDMTKNIEGEEMMEK
jgi:hypothetical protein